MPNITLSLSDETYAYVKAHKEISWSEIARQAIEDYARKLAWMDEVLKDSKLTEEDVEEIGDLIKEAIYQRYEEYLREKDSH